MQAFEKKLAMIYEQRVHKSWRILFVLKARQIYLTAKELVCHVQMDDDDGVHARNNSVDFGASHSNRTKWFEGSRLFCLLFSQCSATTTNYFYSAFRFNSLANLQI